MKRPSCVKSPLRLEHSQDARGGRRRAASARAAQPSPGKSSDGGLRLRKTENSEKPRQFSKVEDSALGTLEHAALHQPPPPPRRPPIGPCALLLLLTGELGNDSIRARLPARSNLTATNCLCPLEFICRSLNCQGDWARRWGLERYLVIGVRPSRMALVPS